MRVQNWPAKLNEVIEKHQTIPFVWGKSDCLHFAREVVFAVTGRHYGIPRYSSKEGAAKALRTKGFTSLSDAIADKFEKIPTAMAQRGDLGTIDVGSGALAIVVCTGVDWAGKTEDSPLFYFPRAIVREAYRVE